MRQIKVYETHVFKGLFHPKMKISYRGILGVYDFLLSDESYRRYIEKISWLFQVLSLQCTSTLYCQKYPLLMKGLTTIE